MRRTWSARRKFGTWRRIWLALAESQHELGLAVTTAQVNALRAHLDDIDFANADAHEARLRHDVMAHVHAYGDAVPQARGIIHLGATSQDVVCNADTLILRDALSIIAEKLARTIDRASTFATDHRALPTLGWTHFQPAQPTTVGKRATLWAQDLAIALSEIEGRIDGMRLRGLRGATGTQASYLGLLGGDAAKVEDLENASQRNSVGQLIAVGQCADKPIRASSMHRFFQALRLPLRPSTSAATIFDYLRTSRRSKSHSKPSKSARALWHTNAIRCAANAPPALRVS